MISDKTAALKLLQTHFGEYKFYERKNEYVFYCVFCNHYKKKLSFSMESGKWHCWVCNSKGRSLHSLLKKAGKPESVIKKAYSIEKNSVYISNHRDYKSVSDVILLPSEYIPLTTISSNPEYKNAALFLKLRGISSNQIAKYNIGYCLSGKYSQCIIIPSYDNNGELNYFIARKYYDVEGNSYINPDIMKSIIVPFELYISWIFPVILVEGIFDAIAVDRNAIPLLGNTINKKILLKLNESNIKLVYLILDGDAKRFLYRNAKLLLDEGFNTKILFLDKDVDPGSLNKKEIWQLLETKSINVDFKTLMKLKRLE